MRYTNRLHNGIVFDGTFDAAVKMAAKGVAKDVMAFDAALREVSPLVAPMALDGVTTPEAVYGIALEKMGVDLRGVPMHAYDGMFHSLRQMQRDRAAPPASDLGKLCPNFNRVRKA